jgi:hypothetical protein
MGQIHRRDSAEIRVRALETASQKYAEGCIPCAESYLSLAREHGATEREIAAIEHTAGHVRGGGEQRSAPHISLDRRKLFRMAATAVVAGVAGNLILASQAHAMPLPPDESLSTDAPELPGAFGVDSCTPVERATVAGMPLHFYIGELGATAHGINCFDAGTAKLATPAFTHGYWGLCGPKAKPDGVVDAAAFGQLQALAVIAAWNNNPYVGGRTLFADVESGFGGWGAPASQADHVALLNGFLQTVTQAGFIPGVYITNWEKGQYFPADYTAPVPFVYWMAGGPRAGTMPAPCGPHDTLHPVVDAWTNDVQNETFGGMQAVVWQYWLSGMGCAADFNYSPQSGYSAFTPAPVPAAVPVAATATTTPAPAAGR